MWSVGKVTYCSAKIYHLRFAVFVCLFICLCLFVVVVVVFCCFCLFVLFLLLYQIFLLVC